MIKITWSDVSKLHMVITLGQLRIFFIGNTPMAFATHDRNLGIISTALSALRKIQTKFVLQFRDDQPNVEPNDWGGTIVDNEVRSVIEFYRLLNEAVEYECLQIGAKIGKKYLRLIK